MDFASLHELLRSTYDEMMPLCAQMTGIAKGIAGLGALFYIALRVWASIARAEAIDVFPLLRPFVLGFCIMFFPTVVLGTMNAVLSPVVQGTEMMVHQQEGNLAELTAKRDKLQEEAYLRNPETAYLVSNEKFDEKIEEMGIIGPEDAVTIAGMYAERAAYDSITKENAEDALKDFYWGENIKEVLRGQKLKLFVNSRVYHYYTEAYQTRHGALPYNQSYDKRTLEGAENVEIVPLSCVPMDFMLLTPKTNMLLLYNQKTSDENFIVERSLKNHYDVDFIANMFFGVQFESVSPEVFAVAQKKLV